MRQYNKTNACDRCGDKLTYKACQERNELNIPTGNWLCRKCYGKDYNNRPDSFKNLKKQLSDYRTGNIKLNTSKGKGNIFEEWTCKWLGLDNLNIKNDNFNSPIDHNRHEKYGIVQTKGMTYNEFEQTWSTKWENEQNKEFDNIIMWCANKDMTKIERIYIFPKFEVMKRTGPTIYKNPIGYRGIGWYEKYRIDDKTVEQVNELIFKRK